MKRNLLTLLIILLSVIYGGNNLSAQDYVAQVGSTKYTKTEIEAAIEAWETSPTNTTMTLLDDVTLTRTITLKSTEHHILNLGTYTMTAASGMNAIEITPLGVGTTSRSCLTINADATNPGGITATKKYCVYYNNSNSSLSDRACTTINGGIFNGDYAIYSNSSAKGNKSPHYVFNGGTFNAQIRLTQAMLDVKGGTFHSSLNCTGISTSRRLIQGGTFKSLPSGTLDDVCTKYWIGTKMANSDVGVYVNNDNYYVVGGSTIVDYTDPYICSVIPSMTKYSATEPLKYSSVNPNPVEGGDNAVTPNPNPNQNGLYYTSIKVALDNNSSKTVFVHTGTLDLRSASTSFTGTINLPKENSTFTVIYKSTSVPSFITNNKIVTNTGGVVTYVENTSGSIITRTYRVRNYVAQINTTYYESLSDAYNEAAAGNVIKILKNFEEEGLELNKNVTINFNTFTYTATSEITVTGTTTLQNGTIKVGDNTITNNGTLNLNNVTLIGSGSNIVLKGNGTTTISSTCNITDGYLEYYGGELFNQSTNIPAIAKKYFEGVGTGHTQNWSTISTPIANAAIPAPTAGIHDLYRFNEVNELWEYYKQGNGEGNVSNPFSTLELGRGYLYANAATITFELTTGELTGNLNTKEVVFPLSYTENNSLAGFNMIGNPFTYSIDKDNLSSTAELAGGEDSGISFYVVGDGGTWEAKIDGKIAPMESVLIQAKGEGILTMSPANTGSKRAARNENSYLTINVASKTHSDVAYVSFNDGMGLDKINHRNPDNPMLYIPVEGKNYAIAMMDKDVKEVPVYFNANRMAEYTISIEQKNCEFSSVVLVDKLTGVETNLLIEDYSFMARSFDNADRFIIRLSIEDNDDSETENFAYVSNGSIVIEKIEGNANIRIFDIMGRHIMGTNATGNANIPVETMSTGMYIIQMSDDNGVKVQKIIID